MDEQQLIKELKEGGEQAFKTIVDNYRKKVINTCLALVHNRADAEDLAQEVFIEVYFSIHKFRSDARLSTWIYRIAVNKSINFNRDNKHSKWRLSVEDFFAGKNESGKFIAEGAELPGRNLEDSDRARLLYKTIDGLPQNQKTAFILNKYEDLSYQEISEVMEVSISSVESMIHRAKLNLQKKLYQCYQKKCI